jgi:hypothetical protein
MKKTQRVVPTVYEVLFETSLIRDEVHALADELAAADAASFLSRIEELQAKALRLVESVEARQGVIAH